MAYTLSDKILQCILFSSYFGHAFDLLLYISHVDPTD